MPTSEERVQRLILRGLMPTDAEAVVRQTDERQGELLTGSEAMLASTITQEQVDQDALWVFWTPDISNRYRRLWTARRIEANG